MKERRMKLLALMLSATMVLPAFTPAMSVLADPEIPEEIVYEEDIAFTEEEVSQKTTLVITNNTGMFKATDAYIEEAEGKKQLVITLSGTGYQKLIKGSFEEACATGRDKSSWIVYQENEEGAYQFIIPLDEGEKYIPIVAVSKRNEGRVDADESLTNYANAFYPRQAEIDYEAGTLTTGDYNHTESYTVDTTKANDFAAAAEAFWTTVSGPNSNAAYTNTMTLTMENEEYDKLMIGSVDAENKDAAVALDGDKHFVISFAKADFKDGEAMHLAAHNAKTDRWMDVTVTVNKLAKTIRLEKEAALDDSSLKAALAEVPDNLKLFTDETAAAVNKAVEDAVYDETATQEMLDTKADKVLMAVRALLPKDGAYQIVAGVKSGMFRLVDVQLLVKDGQMKVYAVASGIGQKQIYLGTAEEALIAEQGDKAGIIDELGEVTNSEGKTGSLFIIPVSSLNTPIVLATRGASKWYERTPEFKAKELAAADSVNDEYLAYELKAQLAVLDPEHADKGLVEQLHRRLDALSEEAKTIIDPETLAVLEKADTVIKEREEEEAKEAEKALQTQFKKTAVAGMKATANAAKKTVVVTFKPMKNATAYQVAYKKNNAAKWTIKTVKKPTLTLTSIPQGMDVQIRVRAVRNNLNMTAYTKYTATVNTLVAQPKIAKVTKGTKSFAVSWGKVAKVSGYQVNYSVKQNFAGAKTKTVSSKTASLTVKQLKAKTKYYVRVRSYKTVGGKKVYGQWSTKKAVTTK